jgi:aflatoxin B1 aldehyde reductase
MKEWLEICGEKGFAKPAFYQGHYNAICRHPEQEFYPLLRKHGIKINAYG